MKNLLALLALSFLFVGCHLHPDGCYRDAYGDMVCNSHHHTETVIYSSGGGYNNNIIVIEDQPMFQCMWEMPYYHDPEWCEYYDGETYCMWMNIGQEEVWRYTDWCGWELAEVYTYLQEEEMKLKQCPICLLPFPSASLFKLRNLKVCANCYVQNKRMFREW